jgi:hypothetical protein
MSAENITKKEIDCLRCGRCCFGQSDDGIKKCRFLIQYPSGKTFCRIYKNRLGVKCGFKYKGEDIICWQRTATPFNYQNCPYNELYPEKPILDVGF